MAWQGIEGHDDVAARFIVAEARGRIAGSYLFTGPPGVGKGAFAGALARALVCLDPKPGLVACGACSSCAQASAGSHPDIDIVAKPDDKSSIPLAFLIGEDAQRMRDGLCWRIRLRPAVGARKVAIILDADTLSVEAANCLLKTLEEPPPGAVIMLVGTGPERQLPTIRSRCQLIRFGALATGIVQRLLTDELERAGDETNPEAIAAAATASGGSIDRARLMLDPDMGAFRERLIGLLAQRPLAGVELSRETNQIVEAAGKEAPPRRARLTAVLAAAIEFYRASARYAATGELPSDPIMARGVTTWSADGDEATAALEQTLDALDAIERNAHLPTLVDAWTAVLEAPRLAWTT
jgi:DNA polymerase-3 subunit delta'